MTFRNPASRGDLATASPSPPNRFLIENRRSWTESLNAVFRKATISFPSYNWATKPLPVLFLVQPKSQYPTASWNLSGVPIVVFFN